MRPRLFKPGDVLSLHNDRLRTAQTSVVLAQVRYHRAERIYMLMQVLNLQSDADTMYAAGGLRIPGRRNDVLLPYIYSASERFIRHKVGAFGRAPMKFVEETTLSLLGDVKLKTTLSSYSTDRQIPDFSWKTTPFLPGEIIKMPAQYPDLYGKGHGKPHYHVVVSSADYTAATGYLLVRSLTTKGIDSRPSTDALIQDWQTSDGAIVPSPHLCRAKSHLHSVPVEDVRRFGFYLPKPLYREVMLKTKRMLTETRATKSKHRFSAIRSPSETFSERQRLYQLHSESSPRCVDKKFSAFI